MMAFWIFYPGMHSFAQDLPLNLNCPECLVKPTLIAPKKEVQSAIDDIESSQYDLPPKIMNRLIHEAGIEARKCRERKILGIPKPICNERKSKGLCNRAVKTALLNAHLTENYSTSVAAISQHRKLEIVKATSEDEEDEVIEHPGYLQDQGFKNMIGRFPTPEDAPLGAVLVYEGGYAGLVWNGFSWRKRKGTDCEEVPCGHIEIKLTNDHYSSDYRSENPLGLPYKLVGVYVKTNLGPYWTDYLKEHPTTPDEKVIDEKRKLTRKEKKREKIERKLERQRKKEEGN